MAANCTPPTSSASQHSSRFGCSIWNTVRVRDHNAARQTSSRRAASRRGLEFAFEARLGDGAAGDPAPYRPPGRRILLDLAARDGRTGVAIDALTVCRSAAEFKPSPAPAGVPAAAVAAAIEDAVGLLLPRLLRQAAVAMQAPAGDRAIATFKRRRA